MAGYLPLAAVLVGAGMRAVGVGIPVGETSAKIINNLRDAGAPLPPNSWFKVKDNSQQKETKQANSKNSTIYDKLEWHVHGVVKVVTPIIALRNAVKEGARSVDKPSGPSSAPSNRQGFISLIFFSFSSKIPTKVTIS